MDDGILDLIKRALIEADIEGLDIESNIQVTDEGEILATINGTDCAIRLEEF